MTKEYVQKVTEAFEEFLIEENYFSEYYDFILKHYKMSFNEFCKHFLTINAPYILILCHPYGKICELGLSKKWANYIKKHGL